MLTITIPAGSYWDEAEEIFRECKGWTLQLEHSLVSISKWESKYHKPFIGKENKSLDETLYYAKCMTLNDVDEEAYMFLTDFHINTINDYIADPMTATTIKKNNKKSGRSTITSEIIYYWMIALGIPSEYRYWHLNRLITLIDVCDEKNKPAKKMSKQDIYARNAAINAANRAKFNSKG